MDEFEKAIVADMTWSFSRLSAFHQCPAMWRRKYIDNDKDETDNAFAEHGSFSHKLIQDEAVGEVDAFEMAEKYEEEYDDNVKHRFPFRMGDAFYGSTLEFFNNYLGHDTEWDGWSVVGVEIPISVKIGGYKVIGYIDLLLEKDGEYMVVDMKSKSKFASKRELAEYSRQLYLYAKYVKQTYKKIPSMEFFLYRGTNKHIRVPYNPGDAAEMEQWVVDTIDKILETEKFEEQIDGFYCNELCDYRESCIFSDKYIGNKPEPKMRFGLVR